jgi:hypothetical protein
MIFFTSHRQNFSLTQISILLLAVVAMSSCGKDDIVIDETLLAKYDSISHPVAVSKPVDSIDCYLDYSYGMQEGMSASLASNFGLSNWLMGKKVNYYKIGASNTPLLINLNSPGTEFTDPANFKEAGSKLQVAIDKIVSNKNRVSLFITDFEKVDDVNSKHSIDNPPEPHPIDPKAWAQVSFREWLNAGNQIDIFAKKFSKSDFWFERNSKNLYPNWIYTLVFTPASIIGDENLYKISVLNSLSKEYLNDNDSKHFTYTTNNFKIAQEKQNDAIGNANDNLVVQENITNTQDKGFEYYYFKSSDLLNFNTDESQKDKRIINKVTVTSLAPCFSDIKYGINVYDITKSLTDFSASQNQQAPEVISDAETGKKDTIANKPVQYQYQKGSPTENVFDFVYNDATKETGIKLKADFTGIEETTIYQVDIVVKSAKPYVFAEEDNVLQLTYAKGYVIKSLGESIKYAMADASAAMENKVLYTIYIKIDNQ